MQVAGKYEVIRSLGRGSFAETLLAKDLRLGRQVAIKVLHPRTAQDWKSFELFEREAMVLRDLRHPAIPTVHDTFRAEWQGAEAQFLVMEYVEGVSLAQLITERRHLDPSDVLHLFVEMLGVLDYLHTRVPPVLHRDIKPANILVRPDGSPALVDFGAVRSIYRPSEETGSTIVGTYGYMPYEQTMGQASPASDLYALAATFLHLLTRRAPPDFMREGRIEVPEALGNNEVLRTVLAKSLMAAPSERYQSARDARRALFGSAPAVGESAAPDKIQLPALRSLPPIVLATVLPRPFDEETRTAYRRIAFRAWDLMSPTEKPFTPPSVIDLLVVGLVSLVTAGIFPAIFWSAAWNRKRKTRHFLRNGMLTTARVLEKTLEDLAFGAKLARVRYEFEADGQRHRDSDSTLPSIAERWDIGAPIQVLYLPDEDYDSIIISAS